MSVNLSVRKNNDVLNPRIFLSDMGDSDLLTGDMLVINAEGKKTEGMLRGVGEKENYVEMPPEIIEDMEIDENTTVTVELESETDNSINNISKNTNQKQDKNNTSDNDTTYEDIGGLDEKLTEIRQIIELPLKRPELFENVGISPAKGVLLHGPPGTGKTLIARAISNEVDAEFIEVNGPEIMSQYKGKSEEKLRSIFEKARSNDKTIIFFDEIDSIGSQRDDESDVENRLVGQLLSLMDGVQSGDDVIVIGATNRVDTLDPALRRSGRFDREIMIGAPNKNGREEILQIHFDKVPLDEDVNIETIAEQTNGFVGADLEALSREAALEAIRSTYNKEECSVDDVLEGKVDQEDIKISMNEINKAMGKVEPSALRSLSATTPTLTFDDIGGYKDEKEFMEEIIHWPMEKSQLFMETNTNTPSGVVIEGDEGVGKTSLVKASAGEFGINLTRVNIASIYNKHVGESEENIQELFKKAEKASPVIIFFEQLDAIAGLGQMDTSAKENVISQLLQEIDRVKNDPTITIIGETTDKSNIDPRLLQSGRLEETIKMSVPSMEEKLEIFNILTRDKPVSEDISEDRIKLFLENKTGGEIERLIRNASLKAIRRHSRQNTDTIKITEQDFKDAVDESIKT